MHSWLYELHVVVQGICQPSHVLALSGREQTRLLVLERLVAHQVATHEAAGILGLSERHTWRMLAAYRKENVVLLEDHLAAHNRRHHPAL